MPSAKSEVDQIAGAFKRELEQREAELRVMMAEQVRKSDEAMEQLGALEDNVNQLARKIQEQIPVEITSTIERLELIEEKLGVRFDGLYGVCVKRTFEDPEDFVIEVNFDVVGTEDTLKRSFSPTLSAYNSAGQLINTETSFINNEGFLGIQSIKIRMLCAEHPIRLRLYPAKPF